MYGARTLKSLVLVAVCGIAVAASAAAEDAGFVFRTNSAGGFTFDTGVLKGELRARGKSSGFTSVYHIPSGARLDRSAGLLGHYRVFTANKRYGDAAWNWPSQSILKEDGSVQARWPAEPGRPFELQALYTIVGAGILQVETMVLAKEPLKGFESFLACYFDAAFTNSRVFARGPNGRAEWISATQKAGDWQAFVRNDKAAKLIQDGRWKINPSPVEWKVVAPYAAPLGMRYAPSTGIAATLVSSPAEAFGVMTPHETEGHYSLYLNLLGMDLEPNELARATARLIIIQESRDPADAPPPAETSLPAKDAR